MANRVVVDGDELPALLDALGGGDIPAVVDVRPSPSTWSAIKPRYFAARDRLRARGLQLPRFSGIPACAIGFEHRELRVAERRAPEHVACTACGLRDACSPPSRFGAELQPFHGGSPIELWGAHHSRLTRTLGIARDPRLDDLVRLHLDAVARTSRVVILEPSVVFRGGAVPSVRLAVFHGPLREGATQASLDGLAAMQRRLGTYDGRTLDVLRAHAPFRAPVGFAADGDDILFKAYAEVEELPPERRRALVRDLLGRDPPDLPWGDVRLLAAVTDGRALRSLKVYVRRDPSLPFGDLAPVDAGGGTLVERCGGRALAVLDLLSAKASKWDLDVRRSFLPGVTVADELSASLDRRDVRDVRRLFEHHDYRSDCVAIGRRGDATTLYFEIA